MGWGHIGYIEENFTLHEVTSNCPLRARSVNVSQVEAAIRIHAPSFVQSVCLIAVYQKYTLPRKRRTSQRIHNGL